MEHEYDVRSGTPFFGADEALYTYHGTILYVDDTTGELRHGLPESCPINVIPIYEKDNVSFMHVSSGRNKPILFMPTYAAVIDSKRIQDERALGSALKSFTRVPSRERSFGLANNGGYLSAVIDGSFSSNIPHLREWEQFHIRRDVLEIPGRIISHRIEGQIIKFFITNRRDWVQMHLLQGDFFERKELDCIRENCHPERIFVDIGANIGNHSIFVAKFCNAKEIIVFEPNPVAIELLKVNVALNMCQNVDMSYLGYALGAQNERLRVAMPSMHNLSGSQMIEDPAGNFESIRGDEVLLSRPIGFLKIDVEYMDFQVLAGLVKTIERWRPLILIEVNSKDLERLRAWCKTFNYELRQSFLYDNHLLVAKKSE